MRSHPILPSAFCLASEFEIQISGGQIVSGQSPHGGITNNKLEKCGKLHVNGTTKVSRAQAPIFLIFVVPRGRCAEGL
jgi:hypothetical protein